MSGARAALAYFHVPDDEGQRLAEYADRKQAMVTRLIQAGDFTAYPDALRFIIAVKDAGIKVAAASSSKNAGLFLQQIRLDRFAREHSIASAWLRPGLTLLECFDADVSGRDFAHGKPDPEMFLTAARELGAAPEDSVVMEDAAAGIQAAKAGGMAAIGIARAHDAGLLAAAHADMWSARWTTSTSARWPAAAWPALRPSLVGGHPHRFITGLRFLEMFC